MIIRRDDNYAGDDDYKDGFDAYNFDDVNYKDGYDWSSLIL